MNWELVGLLVLMGAFALFLISKRKNITTQSFMFPLLYFCMYRTGVGINLMTKLSKKFPRFFTFLGTFGIYIGFLGMAFVSVEVLYNLYNIFVNPSATAGVSLVLPIKAKGVFYVPLTYWIISLAIIVTIHEFAHGVIARLYNVKIKSTGLAFLGVLIPIIPAAFVEPDEKHLSKKPAKQQLAVFAAGPLANILMAALVFPLLIFGTSPIVNDFYDYQGVEITKLSEDFPIATSGLAVGDVVTKLDNQEVKTINDFQEVMNNKQPNDKITVTSDKGTYETSLGTNPTNEEKAYMGIFLDQKKELVNTSITAMLLRWFNDLLFWLFALNLGVGLFNLLPIGPVDGGRMLDTALRKFLKEHHAKHTWHVVSGVFLMVVLGGVLASFF